MTPEELGWVRLLLGHMGSGLLVCVLEVELEKIVG